MTATTPPLEAALIAMLPRLRRYALVLTGTLQQADDLVVDTLAYARETHALRQQQTTLRAWLFTLMHELHVDDFSPLRPRHVGTSHGVDVDSGCRWRIPAAGAQSGHAGLSETLGRFSRLPVAQREILLLVAVEGLSYAETATLLGVPIAAVMARLNRARTSMHSMAVEPPMSGKAPR